MLGLVTGFQEAGARQVVATLWPVDDAATRAFMELFYDELVADDGSTVPAAAAVRRAALRLRALEQEVLDPRASMLAGREVRRRTRPFAAPRHWAAFVCYGVASTGAR